MHRLEANPHPGEKRNLLDEIHFYMGIVRRGWKLIVLGVAVAMVLATIHLARSKTLYRASSRMLLIQQAGRPLDGAASGNPFRASEDSAESIATHLMLIRSPVIVERAKELGGLSNLSTGAIINGLVVRRPDEMARVVELTYKSPSDDEARRVIDGVMRSYNVFLKDNFQKNTSDVIALILKARDDLSKELGSLEQQYLEYRQKNPGYSADEKGRSFLARRLDQWDQSMNQVLARSLQLRSQLDLGRKMASEGLDQGTITNALNQLGGLGGSPPTTPLTTGGVRVASGQSIEKLREELADVESQRLSAELLLTHLKRELAEASAAGAAPERETANAFLGSPEVAKLQAERRQRQAKLQEAQRVARMPNDAALTNLQRRVKEVDDEIQRLWQNQRPILLAQLSADANPDAAAAVRKAEGDLLHLKARKAALTEHLGQLTSEQLRRLQRDREQLVHRPGEANGQIQQLDQQIAALEKAAGDTTLRPPSDEKNEILLGSITRSLEAIEAMRSDLQKKFEEDLDASKKTEISQLSEANLRNNLDRQRTLFNSVVDQLKQAQLVSDFGSVTAQTINPTEVVAEPPKFLSILLMAVVAGCGLGSVGAYLVDQMEARVRTVAEMRELVRLPVIGMIPQLSADQLAAFGPVGLLSHEVPRSALAESYKSTRTNLEFLRRNVKAQVLLVSSPQSGDGKSTTASNLAITLAHAGRKVLLIDGDLRKPSQHKIHNLEGDRGFTDVILGNGSIGRLTQATTIDNMDLITAGSVVSNPAELLASPRLGEVLEQAREQYDIVIIDSSPLLAVTDPSIIASVVDGILLVVRIGATRHHDVERTRDLLETMGLPVLGLVINAINNKLGYGYGYGYGGYGYGQGTQHGETNPSVHTTAGLANATYPPAPSLNGRHDHRTGPYGEDGH